MELKNSTWIAIGLLSSLLTLYVAPATAGCGCEKAPPDAATVRPNATYSGTQISIFHSSLQVGVSYDVNLRSGTTTGSANVSTVAVLRRDLADGVFRPQLNFVLPPLPLGPAAITVTQGKKRVLKVALNDSHFTVTPQPLSLPSEIGNYVTSGYRAAVGRDGTVYVSLNLSNVTEARSVRAQALGYPMVFTVDDATFYNIQGFLMQLLDADMPGLSSVESINTATDSDALLYARHEFNTYFLQHEENQAHALDPRDPNWHLDGTRHIDHDHQILAISAGLYGGGTPAPGATPAFNLSIDVATLFERSLFAQSSLTADSMSFSATFDPTAGTFGQEGVFQSNGSVQVQGKAFVGGTARGSSVFQAPTATVVGGTEVTNEVVHLLPVELPDFLIELGAINLTGTQVLKLDGGSYHAKELTMTDNAVLEVDNSSASVTLYVTGDLQVSGEAAISPTDPSTEKLAIYVIGAQTVSFTDSAYLYGVIFAPDANVTLGGLADTFGAFVGNNIQVTDQAAFYHDEHLSEAPPAGMPGSCSGWCGGTSLIGLCNCDTLCTNYGDCCVDYNTMCLDTY